MSIKHHIGIVIVAALLLACSPTTKTNQSTVRGLTDANYSCADYSQDVMNAVTSRTPSNMPHGFTQDQMSVFYKHYAGIPKAYQDYLAAGFNQGTFAGIFPAQLGGIYDANGRLMYVMGLTQWTQNGPQWVEITNQRPGALEFALQHEIGHAMMVGVANTAKGQAADFYNQRNAVYYEGANNPQIRGYAKTNANEYFAEAFANYYCSPESNDFIKYQLPKTYAFLNSVLEAPVWSDTSTNSSPTPGTNTPKSGNAGTAGKSTQYPIGHSSFSTALSNESGQLLLYVYSTLNVISIEIKGGDGLWHSTDYNFAPQTGWSMIQAIPVQSQWCGLGSVGLRIDGTLVGEIPLDDKRACPAQ